MPREIGLNGEEEDLISEEGNETGLDAFSLGRAPLDAPLASARLYSVAQCHQQAGRLSDAGRLYRRILGLDPRHADSLHALGLIAHQLGQNAAACDLITAAIQIDASQANYYSTLGVALKELGRHADAALAHRSALCIEPASIAAYSNLGIAQKAMGRFGRAVAAYRAALRIKVDHVASHYNLGNAWMAWDRIDRAILCYRVVLCLSPAYREAAINLGVCLASLGHLQAAALGYRIALCIQPTNAEMHYHHGNLLYKLNNQGDAVAAFTKALSVEPRYAAGYGNLGTSLKCLGRAEGAVGAFLKLLRINPDDAEALSNMGVALQDLGRLNDAVAAFRSALRLKPDYADAHSNIGVALRALGRPLEALPAYRIAIAIKPEFAEVYSNQGNNFKALRRLDEAIMSYRHALRIAPSRPVTHFDLGNGLHEQGRYDEAVMAFEGALGLRKDFADAHSNLGSSLHELGRLDEAVAAQRAALFVSPGYAEAHYNLGVSYLLAGRYEDGWREYEWRWQTKAGETSRRYFGEPLWRGENLEGRTILIYAEQGLGDSILFARYVPLVAARGGRVLLEVPAPLQRLMRSVQGVDLIVAKGDELPPFDVQCPLMSLPRVFDTRIATVPSSSPYLAAEPQKVEAWRDRLPRSGFLVGIVWQGNPTYKSDRDRSVPLAFFAPLARVPGVTLISLQKRHGLEQMDSLPEGMEVTTLGSDFDEGSDALIDTAAVVMGLDLIISVDTAVGHLAGALGRPVWLPLSTVPYWPWMLGRADTPWYPNTRLFRQTTKGDWGEIFVRMADRLGRILSGEQDALIWQVSPSLPEPESLSETGKPMSEFNRIVDTKYGRMLCNTNDIYVGASILAYGEWSEGELSLFRQILHLGDVVIEAGANIGAHTVPLAQFVGENGRIYAFEPQRIVFQALCANLALNSRTNVFARQQGLGDRMATMFVPDFDPRTRCNFAGLPLQANNTGEPVDIVTIDSLNLPRCDLIKIDVEGMEADVIFGAIETLARCRPTLYVENDREENSGSLVRLIHEQGYRLWIHWVPLFNPNNFARNSANIFGNVRSMNVICLPIERLTPITGLQEVICDHF